MLIPLHDTQATSLALAGGKGVGLAKAAAAGLPVPDAIIIPTTAYAAWFAPVAQQVKQLLADNQTQQHSTDDSGSEPASQQHSSYQQQSQAVTQLLADVPLPEALLSALKQLSDAHPQAYFAVRSSGSLEDLPGAAFAGLHDTFLNVQGYEALVVAVHACYLSLWNAHVMPYRERLGISDHRKAAMAVVIQQMVDVGTDEAAGVAFSIDPVRGDLKQVLINAAFGLGETVVAGEAAVDEFRVDQQGLVTQRHIARKEFALVRCRDLPEQSLSQQPSPQQPSPQQHSDHGTLHGSVQRALPIEQQTQACINDEQCAAIAQLARQAEAYFGFPQDIEWAFADGELYLLQSRPITRFPARWTRDEAAERFPNPVTPLTWDLCEEGFHRSLNYSFKLMGLPQFYDKWFCLKNGYVYGNQNAVDIYADRLPIAPSGSDIASVRAFIAAGGLWQYTWIAELPTRWVKDLDDYLLTIGGFNHIDLTGKDIRQCWQHLLDINALGSDYFLPNIAISLTQRLLYAVLKQVLVHLVGGDQMQYYFDRLIAITDTKTSLVNSELWQLSRQMRQQDALMTADIASDGSTVAELLAIDDIFATAFTHFLQQHGHREVDFDAYHPTWLETPQTVLAQIRVLAQHDNDQRAEDYWQKKDNMRQCEHEVLAMCADDLRFFIQELIYLARSYTALDDIEHYQTTRLTIPFRRAARAIGERLVNLGALDEAMDVFFLPKKVLQTAIDSHNYQQIRQVASQHKAAWQRAHEQAPDWVYGDNTDSANHANSADSADSHTASHNRDTSGNHIRANDKAGNDSSDWCGLGGSPGVVTGEVFVIRHHSEFAHFSKGAVLVARTTNPAWTPLFYHAAGVITESGGPLSHGAVTARELGIPAVMSIRDACTRLHNGQRVRLDGQAGTVTLLD